MKLSFYLSAILLIVACLLPNHYVPWLASHSEFTAIAAAFFLFIAIFIDKNKIEYPKFFLIFPIIACIPLLQWGGGLIFFFGDAFMASAYLFIFFALLVIGFYIGKNQTIREPVIYGFCLSILFIAVVSIFIALKQWLLLTNGGIWIADLPPGARPFANFGQPNTLSTFLLMGFAASLYMYEKKKIQLLTFIFLFTFIILGVALTQSRTAWVATPCLVIYWLYKSTSIKFRFAKFKILAAVAVYIIFINILPWISTFIGAVEVGNIIERTSTGHNRFYLWQQMLLAIQNQPWFGYGWGQVGVAQVEITPLLPFQEWITHSHNILLDILIWNGIPIGILIIVVSSIWIFYLLFTANSLETVILSLMVIAILVHAQFEYPLEYSFFLVPLGFMLGFIHSEKETIYLFVINRFSLVSAMIFSIVLYLLVFNEYRIAEKDVQLARFQLLNIGNVKTEQAAPNLIILTQLREQLRFMRTEPEKNMTEEQLKWMKKVAYRYATASALHRYAQALALNNQPELAKKHLRIIKQLHGKDYSFNSLTEKRYSLAFEWKNKDISKL